VSHKSFWLVVLLVSRSLYLSTNTLLNYSLAIRYQHVFIRYFRFCCYHTVIMLRNIMNETNTSYIKLSDLLDAVRLAIQQTIWLSKMKH